MMTFQFTLFHYKFYLWHALGLYQKYQPFQFLLFHRMWIGFANKNAGEGVHILSVSEQTEYDPLSKVKLQWSHRKELQMIWSIHGQVFYTYCILHFG